MESGEAEESNNDVCSICAFFFTTTSTTELLSWASLRKDKFRDTQTICSNVGDKLEFNDRSWICKHHFTKLSFRYRNNQTKCGDPNNYHLTGPIPKGYTAIHFNEYVIAEKSSISAAIAPNMKLCKPCQRKFTSSLSSKLHPGTILHSQSDMEVDLTLALSLGCTNSAQASNAFSSDHESDGNTSSDHDSTDSDFIPCKQRLVCNEKSASIDLFNSYIKPMNQFVTPLKYYLIKSSTSELEKRISTKIFEVSNVLAQTFGFHYNKPQSSSETDLNIIIQNMKSLLDSGMPYSEQKQLCRILPEQWGIKKLSLLLGISQHIASECKKLQRAGPQARPAAKRGYSKSSEFIKIIEDFWLHPEISCIRPGRQDYVRVRNSAGVVEKLQRQVLIATYAEVFALFKSHTVDNFLNSVRRHELIQHEKICLATFVKYKPGQAVRMSFSKDHNVCVCIHHENPRLLCTAIGLNDFKDLMSAAVCNTASKKCMFGRCFTCSDRSSILCDMILDQIKSKGKEGMEIKFNQWVHDGVLRLDTIVLGDTKFAERLAAAILGLLKHHFITKSQSAYFNQCKSELNDTTGLVIRDFAENYAPVYQDVVQSMHWVNDGTTTIHPIAMYVKTADGIKPVLTAAISDYMDHNTSAVHCFFSRFLQFCETNHPNITHFHVFSDGCGAQYKSCKAFVNLAKFKHDHPGKTIDWNFFGTGHGKNLCDAIGGILKRTVSKACLRSSSKIKVSNAKEFYDCCVARASSITAFHVTAEKANTHIQQCGLNKRYSAVKTIPGTLGVHRAVPWEKRIGVDLFEIGVDTNAAIMHEFKNFFEPPNPSKLCVGKWIGCVYNKKWYIGQITDVNKDDNEVNVTFVSHPRPPAHLFTTGVQGDDCWIQFQRVLKVISDPEIEELPESSSSLYCFIPSEVQEIKTLFDRFKSAK